MNYLGYGVPIFTQRGVVEQGTQRAGSIGFPTANIAYHQPDISGTYASKVVVDRTEYRAAVYANQKRGVLEAYIFGFSGDLYGKEITVRLLERLAEPKTFQGTQDEKSFIDWAVREVEKYFNQEE